MKCKTIEELRQYYIDTGNDLANLNDEELGVIFARPYHKTKYKSDADKTAEDLSSSYYKKYGKRAGRRYARRTGFNKRFLRDPKHLPG